MNKLYLGLITLVSLISVMTTTVTAATSAPPAANVNKQAGYYSTRGPLSNAKTTLKATLYHPTDIAVVNASNAPIYVKVPGTRIKNFVYPNSQPDHILNDYGSFWTSIEIADAYDNYIWSGTVCDHALVTVYGYQDGYHNVNVDNSYC